MGFKTRKCFRTGGESGIRTHVTLSSKHAFQACAFSHSAISPAPYEVIVLILTVLWNAREPLNPHFVRDDNWYRYGWAKLHTRPLTAGPAAVPRQGIVLEEKIRNGSPKQQ